MCENVANNVFVTDITNCTKYNICINGQPVSQECLNGLYFNAASQSCVASNAQCLVCDPSNLTIYPMEKTCNKYVICFAGTPVLQQCYDDLQFDTTTNKCNIAQKVDCVENQCSISDNVGNIKYIPSQANCGKYYICMNGQPWAQSCATNLQFNSAISSCDLAVNVNCSIKASKRSQTLADNTPPELVNINCPKEGTHFYPHARSNKYYVCVNGKGAMLTCAEGLIFDTKTESCRQFQKMLFH